MYMMFNSRITCTTSKSTGKVHTFKLQRLQGIAYSMHNMSTVATIIASLIHVGS